MDETEQLVRDNWKLAMGIKNKTLKQYSEAMDESTIESDAVLGLYKAAKSYNPLRGKFSTYATTAIKNTIKNSLRNSICASRDKRRTKYVSNELLIELAGTYETFSKAELYKTIKSHLKWDERILIRLVYWEGVSTEQASDMMGHSRKWAGVKISRLLNKLRESLFPMRDYYVYN